MNGRRRRTKREEDERRREVEHDAVLRYSCIPVPHCPWQQPTSTSLSWCSHFCHPVELHTEGNKGESIRQGTNVAMS